MTEPARKGPSLPNHPATPRGTWYDVMAVDPVMGVGARLERLIAASYDVALEIAVGRHGRSVLVTLATDAKPQRRSEPARDLGHTPAKRRTR